MCIGRQKILSCRMDYLIQASQITKCFGSTPVLQELDLSLSYGGITALLGGNGEGKSTLVKLLLGISKANSGRCFVLGLNAFDARQALQIRNLVAYVAEDKQLYRSFTVNEMLKFTSGIYADWDCHRAEMLLDTWLLPSSRKVSQLSKGMRTKLALILALARRARLMILDEPTEGLDPMAIEQLLAYLHQLKADGANIIFSSHHIDEVERVADRVLILHRGKLRDTADRLNQDKSQSLREIFLGLTRS